MIITENILGSGGGSELPPVTEQDKDKYLHTNSTTGDLEWSAVSGGGVLVLDVTRTDMGEYGIKWSLEDVTCEELFQLSQTSVIATKQDETYPEFSASKIDILTNASKTVGDSTVYYEFSFSGSYMSGNSEDDHPCVVDVG